ncbi:SDR family NAD(P)-dependent oxidoreductase [Hoeflea prorocentri]|uniref:SDR family NAD(P)-dependent oxidoreductase n=1 Tax=Hoeflea prorocentri TaxID=1922333 RepID=A0A9X3UEV7_9HYPH|nr:SDR family NAD(P)-dependent oxidoreductase [Hoeflea prorocentri]MCY6379435.1 SDR family NAD(P)-dependent oxidoreductase [Hoeflea prorocentri]MDA5397236.1 SDR family NAD(P)-dependent oxidoreductase [Hoeflea prorocentri]
MTDPLQPPKKKNPQKRTVSPTRPPEARSRAFLGLSAAAAEGRFALQHCAECGAVQYPPRDACSSCLSTELAWKDTDPAGSILAETTIRTSMKLYFKERAPWRTGTVKLDAGPVVICHLHGDCARNDRVNLLNRLDRSGQAVLFAVPQERSPNMEDDPQLRAMTSDPKHRRVLIADARNANAPALAKALVDAGAATVFVGEAESWRPNPAREALEAISNVVILPLDVTDTASVQELAGEIGGKTDILINNARFVRPGGVLARGDTAFARDEMEVNYLGLMRLAQAFGPGMCGRTADGDNSAVAWVNILSVHALSNSPDYGCFSASNAAARSLSQSLRAEFRASGLRVMNVYCGPTEDDWHQPLPPPKVTPQALARVVLQGLRDGLEETCCGDVAKDLYERYRDNPNVLEREMTLAGDGA